MLKLSNLLYKDSEGMLKLADFGLSRPYADDCDSMSKIQPSSGASSMARAPLAGSTTKRRPARRTTITASAMAFYR